MLEINPSKQAVRFLKSIPEKHAKQIAKKVMSLRENPKPNDVKKLVNTHYLRVDSGEYRIIYFVKEVMVYIVLIGKRNDSSVYKLLERKT